MSDKLGSAITDTQRIIMYMNGRHGRWSRDDFDATTNDELIGD